MPPYISSQIVEGYIINPETGEKIKVTKIDFENTITTSERSEKNMIYVTGDCHGDFSKLMIDNFPEQAELTENDYIIICGDFGIWHKTEEENIWFDWLETKPFNILFVDGNHENYTRLNGDEFKVIDFHGGKAHKIRKECISSYERICI